MPDVVSVPEAAGREALARLLGYGQPAVAPGPVALSAAGRVLFYVADGGAEDLPELLEWLDWGGVRLDLTAVAGADLADPPVRWLHPATVPMQRPGTPGPLIPDSTHAPDGTDNPDSTDATDQVGGVNSTGSTGSTGNSANTGSTGNSGGAPAVEHVPRRPSYPTPGLPEAPELIALLATLAAACHRLAVAAAR
ncbi:hypothetical protein ABIA35_004036 [Catenulispora sp. MAP12-49]|uniref:hypothetical protein n=1 Tax=Catenulispora sp. MAP12-49 TaxID=3156302 RepID=UPI003511B999